MHKKWGGERTYLALEDLWIKSNFLRSNCSIQEIRRFRESKNPRTGRKEWKVLRPGKPWRGFWIRARRHGSWLRGQRRDPWLRGHAKICGSDLGAGVRGADLPATSAPLGCHVFHGQASRRQDLRRRDVLPRRRRPRRRPLGSKDQFTSPRGLNVIFL